MSTKYCIKCKSATPLLDGYSEIVRTEKGRSLHKTKCSVCNTVNSRFTKSETSAGAEPITPRKILRDDIEIPSVPTPFIKKSRSKKKDDKDVTPPNVNVNGAAQGHA